jgi:dienelactone hydrolase
VRHVVDRSRRDPFSGDPNGKRELMIQIWYPADEDSRGPVAPYRDKLATARTDTYLSLVDTHSIIGAPMYGKQARYPLLLYSPAWDGVRADNTFHAEELASHGYIVVGMDHPYGSEVTIFPDGRIIHSRLVFGAPFSSAGAEEKFVRTAEQEVRIRAEDAVSVVAALERWNADDPSGVLTARVDLDRIGIFGFSLGGAVAMQACWLDRRFKAGIDMDGLITAESARDGAGAPFLFLLGRNPLEAEADRLIAGSAEQRELEFDWRQEARMRELAKSGGGQFVQLDGMRHFNFSDRQFYAPWPSSDRGLAARLLNRLRLRPNSERAEEVARMINQHLRDFFDQYLIHHN